MDIKEKAEKFQKLVEERQRLFYGERYVGACLSKMECSQDVELKICKFTESPTNFLVYCGNAGLGKTYMCSALTAWAINNYGLNWRYWTENSILKRLRDSMESTKGDYLDCLRYLIDDELIILDDVGSGVKVNEWREEILFNLIDYRHNIMKPTIITSNFSQKMFLEKYHQRIHSRLFGMENTIIEVLYGEDKRLTQNMARKENECSDKQNIYLF